MPRRSLVLQERHALNILALGFVLVLLLLGASGWVAVWRSRAISANASKLGRDQIVVARLIHDVQSAQNAMMEVLHRLAQPAGDKASPREILRNLEESTEPLGQWTGEAQAFAGGPFWSDLNSTLKAFTHDVREILLDQEPAKPAQVQALFEHSKHMMSQMNELIRRRSQGVTEAELEIQAQSEKLRRNSAFLLGASLAFAIACAGATFVFVRNSIKRIQWHANELDRVSWHMLQGQEAAARRFSHELHDELGQSLAAVRSNLAKHATRDIDSLRADCIQLVDQSIANVRELSQLLRPVILDDFGLEAGLQWLADSFAQRTRVRMDFKALGIERYSDETETHLFRIAQEALTNVARHSEATAVVIRLIANGSQITLWIEDNGRGLPPATPTSTPSPSLGMTGMRARARQCGGNFEVLQVVPHGVRVEAVVPCRPPSP